MDWTVSVHTIALSSSGPCFGHYKRTYLNWVNSRRYSTIENCVPTVDAGPIHYQRLMLFTDGLCEEWGWYHAHSYELQLTTLSRPLLMDSGIRKIFWLWNSESLALESGIQLKESGIPLMTGIRNQSSTDKDWNPIPGIWNPQRGVQNPRLSWIPFISLSIF